MLISIAQALFIMTLRNLNKCLGKVLSSSYLHDMALKYNKQRPNTSTIDWNSFRTVAILTAYVWFLSLSFYAIEKFFDHL